MKLLLIRSFFSLEKFYFPKHINEPLGLESLAAFLQNTHQVKILDAVAEGWNKYWTLNDKPDVIYQGLKPKELIKKVNQYQPNIVGLTWLFSTQDDSIKILSRFIKESDPQKIIIVGGPHPSANPKQILRDNPYIDIVVYGEGEITLKELLDKKCQQLKTIQGIAFRNNKQIKVNPARPLIENLNQLPLPDRNSIPYQNYTKQSLYIFIYNRLKKYGLNFKTNNLLTAQLSRLPFIKKIYFQLHNQKNKTALFPTADIVTARGCPNQCTFCAIHNIWGHRWRMRSSKSILEEIDILVKKYRIRHINIQDDNFNISKKRTIEICRGLFKKNYNLSLTANSGIYFPSLDEKVLKWLKKAGFGLLRMSIESGNQRILDKIIKKRIDLSKVKGIVDICRKLGLKTEGVFMFGVPGDTIQTMQDTLNFAKKMNFDQIKKFIFQPFPNTKLYNICIKNNYLTENYSPKKIYVTGNQCYVKTEQFSPEDVLKIAR